jgi:hypothetical protein
LFRGRGSERQTEPPEAPSPCLGRGALVWPRGRALVWPRREEGERRTRLRWLDQGEKRANRPRSPLLSCARPPFRSIPWAGEAASDTAPPCRSIPAASRPKPTTTSTSISRRPTRAAATSSPLPSRFDGKSSSLARSRWRRGYRASTRQTRCRACWLRCSAWRARQTDREAGVSFEVCFLD